MPVSPARGHCSRRGRSPPPLTVADLPSPAPLSSAHYLLHPWILWATGLPPRGAAAPAGRSPLRGAGEGGESSGRAAAAVEEEAGAGAEEEEEGWKQRRGRGRGRREGEREERRGGEEIRWLLGCWAVLMGLFSTQGLVVLCFSFLLEVYDVYDKGIRMYMAPPSKSP